MTPEQRTLLQTIGDDLFGPSRIQLQKLRRAIAGLRELHRVNSEIKMVDRLNGRGWLTDAEALRIFKAMKERIE